MRSRGKKTRTTVYKTGPVSQIPDGSFCTPGLLVASELIDFQDFFGSEGARSSPI
ncbi:hypothetical protein IWX75_000546 [Arthrobacter sp. CAN_A6]